MSKAVQKPVIDKADIPADFVPMASYGAKNSKQIRSSRAYTILAKAWEKKELNGIKLVRTVNDNRGNIFVNKYEADELIAERTPDPRFCSSATAPTKQPDELASADGILLSTLVSELQATSERLTGLMAQLQSAIRAEQDDKNLTLFN